MSNATRYVRDSGIRDINITPDGFNLGVSVGSLDAVMARQAGYYEHQLVAMDTRDCLDKHSCWELK